MIIIIPGFFTKKEFYGYLVDKLQKSGFGVEVVDLGRNIKELEVASKRVLEQLKKTSEKDDIIAHSFGGIILKYVLLNNPEVKEQIKSITFVSVPHGGSWSSVFVLAFPAAREMLPFSKKLKDINRVLLPESTVNFLSERELKVWPRKSSLLKNRIDIVIPDTDHDSIINSDLFISKATEFINSNYDRIFLT